MRIVVSDRSLIIDLRKASLLEVFLRLPYEILIPNTVLEEELWKFTEAQKRALVQGGLVIDLPGELVLRAQQVLRSAPRFSVNDGLAFALAENCPGCILLTDDGCLRDLALQHAFEVQGFLWVCDQLHVHKLRAANMLCAALRLLADDALVRLPARELAAYINRYENLR